MNNPATMSIPALERHWRLWTAALLAGACVLLTSTSSATLDPFVRADFLNRTPTNGPALEPGVIFFPGHLVGPNTAAPETPTGGGYVLRDSAFGQPFSPYIVRMSTNDVKQTYGDEVAAAVLAKLYPNPGDGKSATESSAAAFRYRYLLYSPDTDTNGVTRTVADFDGIDAWYGQDERDLVEEQITNLVAALVVNPLNTTLRQTLLDTYTDRAVAELQFNKQDLVELGKKRLALTLVGEFVINEEIDLLSNVVTRLDGVLQQYADLLSRTGEGVEPVDFDDRWPAGTPFGYYIFATEQPARNASAPQYFNTNGTLHYVPDYDPVLKEIPRAASAEAFTDTDGSGFRDAGEPFTDSNGNGIYDSGSVLFNGFKDYTTLLKVMGEYVRRSAEWARYLGIRRAPGDFARARNLITRLQKETATDFAVLRGMYGDVTFPAGDASGVNAAIGGVERALGDSVNTRTFLQGRGNILGLDENFMVFLQDGSGTSDTYDLLKPLVYNASDPIETSSAFVNAAMHEQALARAAYETFRAAVDQVVVELKDVEDNFVERFEEITGYLPSEVDQFDGYRPKPGTPCELRTLDRNLQSLHNRQTTLGLTSQQFLTDLAGGKSAIAEAENIGATIRASENEYLELTAGAWTEIQVLASASAGAQAVADAAIAAAASPNFTAGIATATAGGINAVAQVGAALGTSLREQQIDAAAIALESELAQVELPLTLQQTRLELGAIQREQYANLLEMEDNNNAIAQTIADRTRLLREVELIQQNFEENDASVRSRFYADPIHLVRSDNAILKADAAFANAQRWMFYLVRALEYKWNQNFVGFYANRDYDSGSIFKLRNAEELKDLFLALENFNSTGRLNFSENADQFTVISLRDMLAPNPAVLDPSDPTDPGVRVDQETGQVVTQLELFRRKLKRLRDGSDHIVIPVNTTRLSDIKYPSFFVGPLYAKDGSISREGRWHDVVRYVKVNIVYPSHGSPTPLDISGKLTYSGMSLFRTRVAPCGLPGARLDNQLDPGGRDIPGELISTPFRYYSQQNLNKPVFETSTSKSETLKFARSGDYVANLPHDVGVDDPLPASFSFNAFTEYSVAATGWELTIFDNPNIDIDQIEDIEFVFAHRSADRDQAVCAP
jgi:hypothetical protein